MATTGPAAMIKLRVWIAWIMLSVAPSTTGHETRQARRHVKSRTHFGDVGGQNRRVGDRLLRHTP